MNVKIAGSYQKDFEILIAQDPDLGKIIDVAVDRFIHNPDDTRLDVHPLHGRLERKYALSVNNDIRIVFEYIGNHHVRFLAIGPHERVYPGYKKK